MSAAVELLRQARAELLRERDAINANIIHLDAMIADLDPPENRGGATAEISGTKHASGSFHAGDEVAPKLTVRDAVAMILGHATEPMRLAEIIENVAACGVSAQDDSIRGIVSKMLQRNEIQRVGYGQYAAAVRDFPTNDNGPEETGPSVAHDPVMGGEMGDAAQPERRRDHDPLSGWNSDHSGTAPALASG